MRENAIEWITGASTVTATLTQPKLVNKIKRLAESDTNVKLIQENSDGTILAHLPLKYLKLSAPRKMTEEQKAAARDRLKSFHKSKEYFDSDSLDLY